jgi:DNA modification methylase
MEINKIYQEPCLETLRKMPNEFIDCVITSPPYWQLRDYGYDGQWGLEPTFQEYLEHLWEMMDEIYRVLKPSGTVWINLGDTYSSIHTSQTRGKNALLDDDTMRSQEIKQVKNTNLPSKCLLLIPHRFAIGCIERGWIVRNDIIWAKRNGMPESVTDRFSKKHEYFFFMVKSEKYYFDLDSIRDKVKNIKSGLKQNNQMGKNCGDVSDFWDIPTKPNKSSHYATYNDELLRKPILSGCPENGIIYDPFMGSGTTAEGCIRSNRNFIGSEMSKEYVDIFNKRINPMLNQAKLF